MVQQRVHKRSAEQKHDAYTDPAPKESDKETARDLKDRMDDLLDEVDEVLEENAAGFVASYIQKGGE